MKYLLDTHAWIWWNLSPSELSTRVRELISDVRRYDELLLSAMSVWEFGILLNKKRFRISCPANEWLDIALTMSKLRIMPVTARIAYHSTVLPGNLHADPADRIIVASALDEEATIITKDRRIAAYSHIKSLW